MTPRGVHKPIICEECKQEMSEYAGYDDWFKCIICGTKRRIV